MTPTRASAQPSSARLLTPTTLILAGLAATIMLLIPKPEGRHTFTTEYRPVLGRRDAPAEIVLFMDYKCPACRAFERGELPRVQRELLGTGRARLVTLQSPFIGPDSRTAARGALCAYQQGNAAFWRMNAALFARQDDERRPWATVPLLLNLARAQDLQLGAFQVCLTTLATDALVQADLDQHRQAGFEGTPAVFVNGVRTLPSFTAIRAALPPAASRPATPTRP